ncbi:MAG: GNAT family N-acetyltransferase [Alphaproteobacteria bacterium]|nr:GNAT family N-acetyltransferase [Alphaproteobacteria bacterium]
MQIRFLAPGDEDILIRAVAFIEEGSIDRRRATAHLADTDLVNLVALDGNDVVGFIYGYVLRRFELTSFFIYSVDIAESVRRRGIGKAMLAALRECGKREGWDEAFVFTNAANAAAMALYQSAGGVRPNGDDVLFDFDWREPKP